MEEWVASDSLRKHLLGVEAAMVAYARSWREDEEMYGVTGLLHDLEYDRYPDLGRGTRGTRSSCSRRRAIRRS